MAHVEQNMRILLILRNIGTLDPSANAKGRYGCQSICQTDIQNCFISLSDFADLWQQIGRSAATCELVVQALAVSRWMKSDDWQVKRTKYLFALSLLPWWSRVSSRGQVCHLLLRQNTAKVTTGSEFSDVVSNNETTTKNPVVSCRSLFGLIPLPWCSSRWWWCLTINPVIGSSWAEYQDRSSRKE